MIGLFLGLGLAKLLNWLFVKIGIDLPHGSTVFATRTVIVSLLVGTLVTLFASIRPARRATRVPPIAAVREGSVLPPSRWAKYGTVTSLVVLVIAIVMVSLGALGSGIATGPRLLLLGLGVLLLFFGVSMNAPKVVRPLAAVLGAPARSIGGAPGILARDNATRNPARTASTASALMIGLALVTFVAIFGAGIRSSFEDAVNELFIGDYALTSTNTFTPIEAAAGQALVGKPGIDDVSAIRAGSARYLGQQQRPDRRAAEPEQDPVHEVDAGQRRGAGRARQRRLLREQELRRRPSPEPRLAGHAAVPERQEDDRQAEGRLGRAKGGSPFAPHHDLDHPVRQVHAEAARRDGARQHAAAASATRTRPTSSTRSRASPTRRSRRATSSSRTSRPRSTSCSTCSTRCSRCR